MASSRRCGCILIAPSIEGSDAMGEVMLEWRMLGVVCWVITSAFLLHSQSQRTPGWRRMLVATPVLSVNLWIPTAFDADTDMLLRVLLGLALMWLGAFKVAGWALGRGPLCERLTLGQFIAVLGLPITPVMTTPVMKGNARQAEAGRSHPATGALCALAKLAALAVVLLLLPTRGLPRAGREVLYVSGLYLFLGMIFDATEALAALLFGLRLAPNFDLPFLATSYTDFWSRRWNLTTGFTCRFLVYDPIVEGRLVKSRRSAAKPSPGRRAAACCAAFAVSGAMHEVFIYLLRGRVSGWHGAFFVAQGPLVVAEAAARRALRARGVAVPAVLAVPLTLGTLLLLGDLLFFKDLLAWGIPQQVFAHLWALLPGGLTMLVPGALDVL